MRWQRIRAIAAFEWRGVVHTRTFWVFTIGFPLAMVAFGVVTLAMMDGPPKPVPLPAGTESAAHLRHLLALGFSIFFGFPLMTVSSAHLVQATAYERESRVGEVLLASVRADELVLGKLIGIDAAILTQTCIWLAPLLVVALIGEPMFGSAPPSAIEFVGAMFVLGLGSVFACSLLLAVASAGTTRGAQQIFGFFMLLTTIPTTTSIAALARAPDGPTANVLSWFPFTASTVTSYRILAASGSISMPEAVGVVALLIGGSALSVRLAARLLRVSLTSAGAPMSWRAALRQSRLEADPGDA